MTKEKPKKDPLGLPPELLVILTPSLVGFCFLTSMSLGFIVVMKLIKLIIAGIR